MKTFNEIYQDWVTGNIAIAKQAVEKLNKLSTVTQKQQFSVIATGNPAVSRISARRVKACGAHAVCL